MTDGVHQKIILSRLEKLENCNNTNPHPLIVLNVVLGYDYEKILMRLTNIIRGLGDPLVAAYARCYLVRVGLTVTPNKEYIYENFKNFLSVYYMIFSGSIRSEINRQRIDINTYLSLYGPALDFVLQALIHKTNLYVEDIMSKCKETKNNGPLLMSILNALKSEYIAANAMEFVKILGNTNTDGTSKGLLFRALGKSVCRCPPLQEQRISFLNASFHTINTFTDPKEYINCVEAWAQFVAENFSVTEVNIFLGNINTRMSIGKAYEKHYPQLQNILDKIMQNYKDIELLLIQEHFLPYLDLFHKESVKIEVCKNILTIFKRNSRDYTSDAIVTNSLMYIGKILNDYVTALTVEDERRQIANLISSFIRKVNFGHDFEQQLSFYVEARGAFPNLDAVYSTLVHAVNKLAIETRQIVKGQHTRKTAAFVKACAAFCFITIPSITAINVQMDLYLLSGQIALLNLCLGQADACFEAALLLVSELPRSVEIEGKVKSLETYLVSYMCNMLATLVVVPDSPEQGVLYLFRLLLDVLNKFPFELQSSGPTTVYLHALDLLYVQSLEEFPYHIPNVISNDELYGNDPKFVNEVNIMCSQVVEYILNNLKSLGAAQQFRTQATLALELFLRIIRFADLSKEKTFQLAINLWLLAVKLESHLDAKLISRTIKSVEETYRLIKDSNALRAQGLAQVLIRIRNK
ncbi:VPS35 endosomal protein sorting factor-like [Teleopsis dalmanni]|uniref:VPS35 endosomal protein sorting factor-like n=1 Tax=Teleopsis dalmanni TaxID=139649 RepID=UPI0018CEF185|nr:VPS35 endosomal protein sorting factor-like [Teleopsis dalmanni]